MKDYKSKELFVCFYNSICRKLYRTNENGEEIGKILGKTLVDDFCVKNSILNKIDTCNELDDLIIKFFFDYFTIPIDLEKNCLMLGETYLYQYGKEKGILLIKGLLNELFGAISEITIIFEAHNDIISISYKV